MRNVLASAIMMTLAMAAPAFAQTRDIPVRVNVGDHFTMKFEDTQIVKSDKELTRITYRTTYALAIEGQNLWRYTPVAFEIVEFVEPPLPTSTEAPAVVNKIMTHRGMSDAMSALMRLTTDIGFLCRVDATGRCVALANWPQWRARLENFVIMVDGFASLTGVLPPPARRTPPTEGDKPNQTAPEASTPPVQRPTTPPMDWSKVRPKVLTAVNAMIDSVDERVAASMILYPVMGPSGVQGRNLSARESLRRAEEWPMPFGAGPIVVDADVTLVAVDEAAQTARVARRATVRPDSVNSAITSSTAFMDRAVVQPFMGAAPNGQPSFLAQMVESAMASVSMSFAEDMTATIDLRTGLVRDSQSRLSVTVRPPAEPRNARAKKGARGKSADATPVVIEWTQRAAITPGAPPIPRLERPAQ
jgi:hypothetical protein